MFITQTLVTFIDIAAEIYCYHATNNT